MEGGNKQSIDLGAGIDIHTSDMLVPVTQATFQHNWQRYQGKYLANSLRFEKNGWAAGWNVFNFKYSTFRKKLADNAYLGISKLNQYVMILSIFDSETSYNSLQDYYVIRSSSVLSGDVSVTSDHITGALNNKAYSMYWDQSSKTAKMETAGFSIEQTNNTDYSTTIKVTDTESSIDFDFDLLTPSVLSGDSMSNVNYTGYSNDNHTWGNYSYNAASNKLSTPEGVDITPTVSDNKITYDYDVAINDESFVLSFMLNKKYLEFKDIYYTDYTKEVELSIGNSPAKSLLFNYYYVTSDTNVLKGEDESGVIVDLIVPLWATCGFNIELPNRNAKKCDNVKNKEVGIKCSGYNIKYKVTNIFTNEEVTGTLPNIAYNVKKQYGFNIRYISWLENLTYRFNKIILYNTIERGKSWSPFKYIVNSSDVYAASTGKYSAFKSSTDTANMKKLMGNVFTYGSFKYSASEFIAQNNPWETESADQYIAETKDISDILSIRSPNETDSFTEGDDEQLIDSLIPSAIDQISKYIVTATDTSSIREYSDIQAYVLYDVLYSMGTYTYGTYEKVDISADDDSFWPFGYVPKFNLKLSDGTTVKGVYWTDGVSYITDIDRFKKKILGSYSSTSDSNNPVKLNTDYSRTRLVTTYKAGFDFDGLVLTEDNTEEYQEGRELLETYWSTYYPDYASPLDTFKINESSGDQTYLDYNDITKDEGEAPDIIFATPGVYIYDYYAIPFGNDAGVIIYEDTTGITFKESMYHHDTDALSLYNYTSKHTPGRLYVKNSDDEIIYEQELPYYFGKEDYLQSFVNLIMVMSTSSSQAVFIKKGHLNPASLSVSFTKNSEKCWFDSVDLAYCGTVSASSKLSTGVNLHDILSIYKVGDVSSGVKFGVCVQGHTQTRLTYTKICDESEIYQDGIFVLEKVPTAQLSNSHLLMVDRSDSEKCIDMLELSYTDKTVDQAGTGYYALTADFINSKFLWYAKQARDSDGNETTYDYYLPGIIYGSTTSETGHMSTTTNSIKVKCNWTPVSLKMPENLICKFSNNNSKGSSHVLYTTMQSAFAAATASLGTPDYDNYTMPATLSINGVTLNLSYDMIAGEFKLQNTAVIYNNEYLYMAVNSISTANGQSTISLDITLHFKNNTAKFIKLNKYTLLSSDGDILTISNNGSSLTYSINQQSVISPKCDNVQVTSITNGQHVYASKSVYTILSLMMQAVYNGTISDNTVTFTYQGNSYSFDLSDYDSTETGITVVSTDIRNADNTDAIGFIKPDGQYQLLKQQWNSTTEVENFWWVDSKHILELNKYFFVLKRNTDELDDWNGNRFEITDKISRDKILPTNVIRYFVTNIYNSNRTALIVTLKEDSGNIVVTLYNPRDKFVQEHIFSIRIRCKQIGNELNDVVLQNGIALFNTYNPLTAAQVLSKADWSNTVIDDRLILGCHLSNNYDQWALVYNLTSNSIEKVIQGYGYVGLHGDLTGGQIPDAYFDVNKGFNSTVQDFSALNPLSTRDLNDLDAAYEVEDLSELNKIDAKVVGTSEQQWYIQQSLYGVVSHLTYNNGSFTKQLLPITNNFASVYKSPSFSSSILGDCMVQAQALKDLFDFGDGDSIWFTLCLLMGYPFFFLFAPRYSTLAYLQQTFGQYAYVHYNSSKSLPEKEWQDAPNSNGIDNNKKKQTDPVLSGYLTFDKQKISQYTSTELNFYETGLVGVLLAAMSAGVDWLDKKMSVNEEQNQTSISDFGRKFVDNAIVNTESILSSAIITQSKTNVGIKSVVTGLKSLDMFYSTCDQQRVFAGPGFVEHQMVADCVAQSVTDTQVEGKLLNLFYCLSGLTLYQVDLTIKIVQFAVEKARSFASEIKEMAACANNIGSEIALGIDTVATAAEIIIQGMEIARDVLADMLDVISSRGVTSSIESQISRHALSVEGKHKYGEKNERFMWPCWGVTSGQLKYTDEKVCCGIKNTPWELSLKSRSYYTSSEYNATAPILKLDVPSTSSNKADENSMFNKVGGSYTNGNNDDKEGDCYRAYRHDGLVPFYQASAYGETTERTLPDDMAKIEGVSRLLPDETFKNENVAVSEPAFAPSLQQDYIIDKNWDLSQYCTYGISQWIAVKDTKVIDCAPSNLYVNSTFCGIASPYTAVEVRRGIIKEFMRPWAITPNTLAFNCTGYNSIFDNRLYHAFDGISFRIVDLVGSPGMNKSIQSFFYSFQVNDRFKRSNIVPANELQGNFVSEPVQAIESIDKLWTEMTIAAKEKGMVAGIIGEDKDSIRWSVPVFTEHVSTLPAAVKTLTAVPLGVVDGVTSLCVNLANNQVAYKAPLSVDFVIGKQVYRITEEYICSVKTENGIDVLTDLVPILGLTFIGATPTAAYLWSQSTRCYYVFSGNALTKVDTMERFRNIQKGYWDFVNQEVVMPCLMTFKRLNNEVEDKDTETDNIIVPVMSGSQISGELPPPLITVFNDRSWYKCVSLPCGFAYQGPNRIIINRNVFIEYMLDTLKSSIGKWKRLDKERYCTKRIYPEVYSTVDKEVSGVDSWTYNQFLLVTSALGATEDTDCLYEWNITFCWPIEMDLIYGTDNYATVNVMAETMTPGGKVKARPTHIYLTKELFTRNGNYGYYSFKYQSKNGAGNRERLHIWSDQYIAISSIDCEYKVITSKRTAQLTQQVDIQHLKEL